MEVNGYEMDVTVYGLDEEVIDEFVVSATDDTDLDGVLSD